MTGVKYIVKPAIAPEAERRPAYDSQYCTHLPELLLYEENAPKPTGLVDVRGNQFFRVKQRGKLGF